MRIISFLILILLLSGGSTAIAEDAATSPTLGTIHFKSSAGLQTEIWIDGKRAGITPFSLRLPEGEYWMTASVEYITPLMQHVTAEAGREKLILLPADPVTTENFARVSSWVMQEIGRQKNNPHLFIIALYLTVDPAEGKRTLEMVDQLLPGDAMVDLLRGKILLRANRPQQALEAVERGMRTLPKLGFAWRLRADILRHLGRLDEALDSANQAVALEPFGWRNVRVRAKIHEELGNTRAQQADEQRARELYEAVHKQIEKFKERE